jgi:hypothetical protein
MEHSETPVTLDVGLATMLAARLESDQPLEQLAEDVGMTPPMLSAILDQAVSEIARQLHAGRRFPACPSRRRSLIRRVAGTGPAHDERTTEHLGWCEGCAAALEALERTVGSVAAAVPAARKPRAWLTRWSPAIAAVLGLTVLGAMVAAIQLSQRPDQARERDSAKSPAPTGGTPVATPAARPPSPAVRPSEPRSRSSSDRRPRRARRSPRRPHPPSPVRGPARATTELALVRVAPPAPPQAGPPRRRTAAPARDGRWATDFAP